MPAISRPPDMVSIIASSSATRTGFRIGRGRPHTPIFGPPANRAHAPAQDLRVGGEREARIMVLGNRYPVKAELVGATELVKGGLHRPYRRLARIILTRERPDVVRRRTDVTRGAEEGCLHFKISASRLSWPAACPA